MRRTGAAHDGENHMVLMPGGVGANFRPDGQRTFVGMGSSIRRFYGDGDGEPVLETDAAGVVTAVNVSDPEGLAGRVESGSTRYYMFDAQGSVANETDASGNLVNSRYYDAYGWEARVQGPSGANVSTGSLWGWNARWGCYFDRAVGTYHMGAREYAPGMGRFLERDPIGFDGGINLYAYCEGSPVGAADPLGLWSWRGAAKGFTRWGVGSAIGFVAGAVVTALVAPEAAAVIGAVALGLGAANAARLIIKGLRRRRLNGDPMSDEESSADLTEGVLSACTLGAASFGDRWFSKGPGEGGGLEDVWQLMILKKAAWEREGGKPAGERTIGLGDVDLFGWFRNFGSGPTKGARGPFQGFAAGGAMAVPPSGTVPTMGLNLKQ